MIARHGSVLTPDYAVKYLDFGHRLIYGDTVGTVDILANCDHCDFEDQEEIPFDDDYREVLQTKVEGIDFELLQDDAQYLQVLTMIVKVLADMNADERSAFFKSQYI